MQRLLFLLLFVSCLAQAQAPVEERQVQLPAHRHAQIKADFARKEKAQAAERVQQAETELAESKRAQQEAEKKLQAAQQRVAVAQNALMQAQAQYRQAETNAAQTAAELEKTWKK